MSDDNKSRIEKKIDQSLGITSSDDDEFDMTASSDDTCPDTDLEEQQKKEKEQAISRRRDIVQEQQNALAKYAAEEDKGYDADENFARDILKDVALSGVSLLRIQEEEMQLDPSARNAETAAAIMNAVTTAADKLQGIGLNNKKLVIEEKKVGVKEAQNGIAAQNGAMIACSFAELIGQLKEADENVGKVQGKIKDTDAEVIEDKSEEVEEEVEEENEDSQD